MRLPDCSLRSATEPGSAHRHRGRATGGGAGRGFGHDDASSALALQLCNLHTVIEMGVDKNATVALPGPLMSTIQEIGGSLTRENGAIDKLEKPLASDQPPDVAGPGADKSRG